MGRQLRSHLSLLHPDFTIQDRVLNKQQSQKDHHNSRANRRHFTIGDTVFVHDFPTGNKWLPGTVTQKKGPLSFLIKLADGRVFHRHIDHIRERPPSADIPISTHPLHDNWPDDTIPHNSNPSEHPPSVSHSGLRRTSRKRKPPDRFH